MTNKSFRFTSHFFIFILLLFSLGFSTLQGDKDDLAMRAVNFVKFLSTSEYETAVSYFDSNVKNLITRNKLENIWIDITGKVGAFKSIKKVKQVKQGNYQIIFVTCKFELMDLDIKLSFNDGNEIAGMYFVPAASGTEYKTPPYVLPGKFKNELVSFGADPWKLPGTLSIPNKSKLHPVVILVHGSGPNDRDETIGPNKPFRDIAEGLASKEIAVLRYEKRTKHHQAAISEMKNSMTVNEETVIDALAAIEFLCAREDIDRERIFLLGHSLGGMMVPRIGLKDSVCTGFILLAAPNRPLEDAILDQITYIFNLDSVYSEEEMTKIQEIKMQVNRVKQPNLSTDMPADSLPLGISARYWLDLRDYKPSEEARNLKRPLLILHGERDYQVTSADLTGWRKNLAYENDVEIIVFPGLNHLFITGDGPSRPEEYMKSGNVAPEVIQTIVNWIEGLEN